MTWTSVRVRPYAPHAAEAVSAALFAAGSQGIQEDGDALVAHFPAGTNLDAVRVAIAAADARAELFCAPVADEDWSEAWKREIVTHEAGGLTITPPWLAAGLEPARTVIIDPGMAFGTGDHPTTRGVLALMRDAVCEGDTVADLGAGSAVLSIAAAKLGASRVAAVELDPDAIGNAEANVARNGCAARVAVIEGDATVVLPLLAPVDVVLANLLSSTLLPMLPVIHGALAPGGRAILGGILLEERDAMLVGVGRGEWRINAEVEEAGWWSVAIAPR